MEEKEFRKVTLEAIVEDGTVIGFRVDGFSLTSIGRRRYMPGLRTYTIRPAGKLAPDVFKVVEKEGELEWPTYEVPEEDLLSEKEKERRRYIPGIRPTTCTLYDVIEETIVSGREKAMEVAYRLALKYAALSVQHHNRWVKNNYEYFGDYTYRRAILEDNCKK